MRLTVEAADGALIARLDGYRPGVLDADRAADLFFKAVLAALQPAADIVAEPTVAPPVEVAPVAPPRPTLLELRSEALHRLDGGEALADVARAVDVPLAVVRRWDEDPTWAAS